MQHGAISSPRSLYRDRKHSSNSISSVRAHGESRIPTRPHLGSVPSCQAICSHARWLGLEEVWWTMESCMDHTTLDRQGFYYELPSCKCKTTCKGNCKCHRANPQCTSLNHCELVMDSVMETELTARPDTNSGLHYKPMYMYRGQLSWIQIRSYTYSLPEKVSHSYCYSNCLRFKTVDLRNYVLTVAILESNMAGIGY